MSTKEMGRWNLQIELRHLRYFLTAAEQGSFRRAANVIKVHESAISRRIRDLEDRIGATLFNRHTGGVSLTYAGERFLRQARHGLKTIQEGAQSIAPIGGGEEGRLRIGIFSSLASGFLSSLLLAFGRSYTKVQIEFINGNPSDHVAAVRRLQLDVAFITGTSAWADCDTMHLWSERVFVVLPTEHPLARKEELKWVDLADESFIVSDVAPGQELHDYLVQRLAELGHHPMIQLQYVGRDNILSLVAVGRSLTVTSEATTVAQIPGIVYRPIASELLPFSAVWSPKNDNPVSRRFLSMARIMANSRRAKDISFPVDDLPKSALPLQTPDLSR